MTYIAMLHVIGSEKLEAAVAGSLQKQEAHGPHPSPEEDCQLFLILKIRCYLPFLKGVALYLDTSEFPLPKDTLC